MQTFRLVAVLAAVLLAGGLWLSKSGDPRSSVPPAVAGAAPGPATAKRLDFQQLSDEWSRGWLAPERDAQRCESVVVWWWDQSRVVSNAWDVFAGIEIPVVRAPQPAGAVTPLADGCFRQALRPADQDLAAGGLRAAVRQWEQLGWRVAQSEWRLVRYDPAATGPTSRLWTEFHLNHTASGRRGILRGHWELAWEPLPPGNGTPRPRGLRWLEGELLWRDGPPRFELASEFTLVPAASAQAQIDPLVIADLDGDGREEIVLVGANRRLQVGADGRWTEGFLLPHDGVSLGSGVIEDFTGDGQPDLLVATAGTCALFAGRRDGSFEMPPLPTPLPELRLPTAVAATDLDGDGDLDVFLGQYQPAGADRQFPAPFGDCNNGLRCYLLRNQGQGQFTNTTSGSGLDRHLWRRNYTACFLDFDEDGAADFLRVNDFAGVDFLWGQGGGRFRDDTAATLGEARQFGMGHVVEDFDGDGRPDLLTMGMTSPAADRMSHLNLSPPGFEAVTAARGPMSLGNRVWLNRGRSRWEVPAWAPEVARTGWTWGATTLDQDNDGRTELYFANGFRSEVSATDWENEFWSTLVYFNEIGTPDAWARFNQGEAGADALAGKSSGGHYRNKLLVPGAAGWQDQAWLSDVALPQDSLCVAAHDFDGDGRQELVVTTAEVWPVKQSRVLIYRNRGSAGNWLQVAVPSVPGRAPYGTKITVLAQDGRRTSKWLLDQSGYQTQPAPVAHFGLGAATSVAAVEVRWPDGATQRIENPNVNRRLRATPPSPPKAAAPGPPK